MNECLTITSHYKQVVYTIYFLQDVIEKVTQASRADTTHQNNEKNYIIIYIYYKYI